mmetsp:Transcript_19904/g.22213  ORF Transcript_19904/g.22213 Transcript_19904/m.22213 type:complete len:88 (-) Transcript_19904:151-414(-)
MMMMNITTAITILFFFGTGSFALNCDETVCSKPAEVGKCRMAVPRYHYNTESGKCEIFTWGGCDPKENNFKTVEECNNICGDCFDIQ